MCRFWRVRSPLCEDRLANRVVEGPVVPVLAGQGFGRITYAVTCATRRMSAFAAIVTGGYD